MSERLKFLKEAKWGAYGAAAIMVVVAAGVGIGIVRESLALAVI